MVVIKTIANGEKGAQLMIGDREVSLEDEVMLLVGMIDGERSVIRASVRELAEKSLDLEYTYHTLAPEMYDSEKIMCCKYDLQ